MSDTTSSGENTQSNSNLLEPQSKKANIISEIFSFIKSLSVFVIVAILLRGTVVEAFRIPSSSMESTLEIGDHILVSKLSYGVRLPLMDHTIYEFSGPQRGDIVVFTLPDVPTTEEDESDINIIKRIIGLPGDNIEVRGTRVFVNGEQYSEDAKYARWLRGGIKNFGPIVVPQNTVFLMGDNRDFSKDSRFWDNPFLDISRIKGKAFFIYWNRLQPGRIFDTIG